jgi:beta-galactosidase
MGITLAGSGRWPQYRLYCPGVWLHKGKNTIIVFDMLQKKPAAISGKKKLK